MGWFRVVMAQVLWVDAAWCGLDNSQNVYFYGNLSTASKFPQEKRPSHAWGLAHQKQK